MGYEVDSCDLRTHRMVAVNNTRSWTGTQRGVIVSMHRLFLEEG